MKIALIYRIQFQNQEVQERKEPKMLKEYLSEAVSLLSEAVLGRPVSAGACWYEDKVVQGLCHGCGLEKRIYTLKRRLCCASGCYGWAVVEQWCDYC